MWSEAVVTRDTMWSGASALLVSHERRSDLRRM